MSSRNGLIVLLIVAAGLLAGEAALLSRNTSGEHYYSTRDREATAMADRLIFTDTAEAFRAGTMHNLTLVDATPARLTLDEEPHKGYPRHGTWTSKQIDADFPFTELLPCWNLLAPTNTGVVFHVRTRDVATGEWSPWLHIGSWGRIDDGDSVSTCKFGGIDTDTLKLTAPANAYQIRATLQSFALANDITPAVRRIAVTYSGPLNADSVWAKAMTPNPGPSERWAKDLPIPYRAQGRNAFAVTGMTCSPTSVSMVLQYFGVDRPTNENALAIWDDHNMLFGNWANAVQRAGEMGMDAWLQRFRNWDQVKEMIAQGQPVIASIAFEKDSYEDSPIFDKGTEGHLIVIRGFTPDGMVIVNDPASAKHGDGVLYPPRGLAHAWFGHGGVGYVIHPPAKPLPASLVKAVPATMPTTAPVASR